VIHIALRDLESLPPLPSRSQLGIRKKDVASPPDRTTMSALLPVSLLEALCSDGNSSCVRHYRPPRVSALCCVPLRASPLLHASSKSASPAPQKLAMSDISPAGIHERLREQFKTGKSYRLPRPRPVLYLVARFRSCSYQDAAL